MDSMGSLNQGRCSVEGCEGQHKAKGLCQSHYCRSYRAEHVEAVRDYNRQHDRLPHRKNYNKTPERRAVRAIYMRQYRLSPNSRIREKATDAVGNAVRSGRLQRKPCEQCGKAAQAHHDSYHPDNWLNVRWLCPEHHALWHTISDPIYPLLF